MNGLIVEVHLCHVIHVVTKFGLQHIMGNHGIEHRSFQFDTVIAKHLHVVLDVLAYFHNLLVFIELFEYFNKIYGIFTVCWNRHIKCFFRLNSKAQTNQFCLHGVG